MTSTTRTTLIRSIVIALPLAASLAIGAGAASAQPNFPGPGDISTPEPGPVLPGPDDIAIPQPGPVQPGPGDIAIPQPGPSKPAPGPAAPKPSTPTPSTPKPTAPTSTAPAPVSAPAGVEEPQEVVQVSTTTSSPDDDLRATPATDVADDGDATVVWLLLGGTVVGVVGAAALARRLTRRA